MKKHFLFLLTILVAILAFATTPILSFADEASAPVESIVFRYANTYGYKNFIFDGEQLKMNLGISSGDNNGENKVGLYLYNNYESQYIKWNNNDIVKLGTENVEAIADGSTHYGIEFGLQTNYTFSSNVKIYLQDDSGNIDITTMGKTQIIFNSERTIAYIDLDLGEAITASTINLETNGGYLHYDHEYNNKTKIELGSTLTDLPNPTKTKYVFDGWYTNAELTNKFISTNPITADEITLYAKYKDATKIDTAIINFDMPEVGQTIVFDSATFNQTPQLDLKINSTENYSTQLNDANLLVFWFDPTTSQPLNNVEITTNVEYEIQFYIKTKDGCYFNENLSVIVNGNELTEKITIKSTEKNRVKVFSNYSRAEIYCNFKIPNTFAITLNENNGTIISNPLPTTVTEGNTITLPQISNSLIQAPTDKTFDAYEINGTRYEANTTYTPTANTTIKILWKDIKPATQKTIIYILVGSVIFGVFLTGLIVYLLKHDKSIKKINGLDAQ